MLLIVCGFISYPIWTRILSTSDYGYLSLVTATVFLVGSSSKFGIQHAALRFYSDHNSTDKDLNTYYSTLTSSNIVMSALTGLVFIVFFYFFGHRLFEGGRSSLVYMTIALGILNSIIAVNLNIMSARQDVRARTTIEVTKRYSDLILALVFVLLLMWGLNGILVGWLIADLVVLGWIFLLMRRHFEFELNAFSFPFLKVAVVYGLPMVAFEITTMLLTVGDRYIIQYIMGPSDVGLYSAGYNICIYVGEMASIPLSLAVIPAYLEMWKTKGPEETAVFLGRALKYYFLACVPLIFGLSHLSREIIVTLATSKFDGAHTIVPYVITALILYGPATIYGAGFFIEKRSGTLAVLTLAAAALNIALNLVLIPRYGIQGAAMSTLVSYVILCAMIFVGSRRNVRVPLPAAPVLKYVAASLLMLYVLGLMETPNLYWVFGKVIIGAGVYSAAVFAIDAGTRRELLSFYNSTIKLRLGQRGL